MEQKGIATIMVVVVAVILTMGVMTPVIIDSTTGDRIVNEGSGWVRFALDRNAGTTYTLSYTEDENGFYIDNGTDRQTYDDSTTLDFETILYADSNLSVWVDGAAIHILGTNEGNPFYLEGSGDFTIVRDAEGVTVTPDGSDPVTFGVPTWSYIPVSTGNYGFFLAADLDDELGNGVKNYPSDMPLAVVGGGFAGVYAYNDIYRYNGLGLNMHPVYDDDGLFYGAYWDKTVPVEPESLTPDVFDPSVIDFDPSIIDLDPITLDPGAQLMSVPTPTYTDGDWGYDLTTVDGVTKAVIVSYSGAGGNIVVPATVGGYDVYRFGKATPSSGTDNSVFNNSNLSSNSTITFTNGLVEIGSCALKGVNKITGTLVIPDSVTTIGKRAFMSISITNLTLGKNVSSILIDSNYNYPFGLMSNLTSISVDPDNSTFTASDGVLYSKDMTELYCYPMAKTGSFSIPDTVEIIKTGACYYLTTDNLVIPDSVTTIERSAFYNLTSRSPIIIPDSVTSIGPYSFYKVSASQTTEYLKLGAGLTEISNYSFNTAYAMGTLILPENITTIANDSLSKNNFETIVIPNTIVSITGDYNFGINSRLTNIIYASESAPSTHSFYDCPNVVSILDLSDAVDLSPGSYGIPASATVSDSIGDCFGFVSVIEIGSDPIITGPIATLLIAVPLLMVVGITIAAMTVMRERIV